MLKINQVNVPSPTKMTYMVQNVPSALAEGLSSSRMYTAIVSTGLPGTGLEFEGSVVDLVADALLGRSQRIAVTARQFREVVGR